MSYALHIITMIAMTIPVALGYNFVFGRAKILHFGSLGTSLLTVYTLFLVQRATGSYAAGLLSGFIMSMAVSFLFTWLALRLESDAFGILSIAVHLAVLAVVLNWTDLTRGALGIPYIPRFSFLHSSASFAIFAVSIAVAWHFFMARIDASPLGRSLIALADHRFHAEALGISRATATLSAFLIAGAGSFLSNMMFPQYLMLLHPNDYMFPTLVSLVMYVVAGGPGSVRGVTCSVILLMLLQEGIRFVSLPLSLVGPLRLVLFGTILLIAVWLRRDTIFPKPRTI